MSDDTLRLELQASLHWLHRGKGYDDTAADRSYRAFVDKVLTEWVKAGMNPMACKGCDGDYWNRDMTRCCDESWCETCFPEHITSHGAKND